MSGKTFTAWITKYALTTGIQKCTVRALEHEGMVEEVGARYTTYYHGKDWHRTREGAVARAKDMRAKKIASLRKKIVELEKLTFDE